MARNTHSPPSDTDGSEDVFLDLAQSDDESQPSPPQLSRNRLQPEQDSADNTLRGLPGSFPDKITQQHPRPQSSGIVAPQTGQVLGYPSGTAAHKRHASQPNGDAANMRGFHAQRGHRQPVVRDSSHIRPLEGTSQVRNPNETPRLRRQRRLMLGQDGASDNPSTYQSDDRSATRPSLQTSSFAQAYSYAPANAGAHNDSDSVGSQTAVSTVWDELDDLKSRIKRLEGTGRIPSTANAAIASHASTRPQTATTAPTTVSSPPRQMRKPTLVSAELAEIPGVPADVHPTLQSALARARSTLKPHIYSSLEASVIDALSMAAVSTRPATMTHMSSVASTVNGAGTPDRHIRRKIDSLCRNLADLCIAMCDVRAEEAHLQPSPLSARRHTPMSPRTFVKQSIEQEPQLPDMPAALQGRRGSRNGWTTKAANGHGHGSHNGAHDRIRDESPPDDRSPSTTPKDYVARYSRRGRDESTDEEKAIPDVQTAAEAVPARAPSRAMTDAGHLGFGKNRDHLRTSTTARSPSLRDTLEARRKSVNLQREGQNEAQSTVSVSGQTPTARRFLERVRGVTPSESGSSISFSGTRQRYGTPEHQTPSPRLASAFARRESLTQRRYAT